MDQSDLGAGVTLKVFDESPTRVGLSNRIRFEHRFSSIVEARGYHAHSFRDVRGYIYDANGVGIIEICQPQAG